MGQQNSNIFEGDMPELGVVWVSVRGRAEDFYKDTFAQKGNALIFNSILEKYGLSLC
jgi:hypothetical protein